MGIFLAVGRTVSFIISLGLTGLSIACFVMMTKHSDAGVMMFPGVILAFFAWIAWTIWWGLFTSGKPMSSATKERFDKIEEDTNKMVEQLKAEIAADEAQMNAPWCQPLEKEDLAKKIERKRHMLRTLPISSAMRKISAADEK